MATRLLSSGGFTERDGYIDNITTGTQINDRDRYSVRGQFLFLPSDNVSVRVIADLSEIDERCCTASNILDGPADTNALFIAAGGTLPPTGRLPNTSFILPIEALGGTVVPASQFHDDKVAQDIDPFAEIEESGVSVEVNWDLDNFTFFQSF